MPDADPFLEQVLKAKADAEVRAAQEVAAHEQGLKDRFAEDVALRDRLAKFARESGLDKALIEVWQEVESYRPTTDPDYMKLSATDISSNKVGDTGIVRLSFDGVPFEFHSVTTYTEEAEVHVKIALLEAGQVVFGINTEEERHDHYNDHRPVAVTAFRRQGTWATMLFRQQGILTTHWDKFRVGLPFREAEDIKTNFSE